MDEDAPEEVNNSDYDPNNGGVAGVGAVAETPGVEDAHARKKRKRKKKKKKKRHRSDSNSMDTESLSTMSLGSGGKPQDLHDATDSEDETEEGRPRKRQALSPTRYTTLTSVKVSELCNPNTNTTNARSATTTQPEPPKGPSKTRKVMSPPRYKNGSTPTLSSPATFVRAPPASLLEQEPVLPRPPSAFPHVDMPPRQQSPEKPNNATTEKTDPPPPPDLELPLEETIYGEPPQELDPQYWTIQHVHSLLLTICWSYIAVILVYAFLHPAPKAGATTVLTANSCFRNNVHSPIKYQGDCAHQDPTSFPPCPTHALCYGGKIHDCRFGGKSLELKHHQAPDFYELIPTKATCEPRPEVTSSLHAIVKTVEHWTLAYACRDGQPSSSLSSNHPEPANVGGSQPLFVLTDVTKQLLQIHDDSFAPPFDVHHPVDAHTFVSQFQQAITSIQLSAMPNLQDHPTQNSGWLGRRFAAATNPSITSKPHIPPGTPLIGLTKTPQDYFGRSLYLRCWWKGIPRNRVPNSANDQETTARSKESLTKATPTTNSPKEPSVTRKVTLKVKPAKVEPKTTEASPKGFWSSILGFPFRVGTAVMEMINERFFKKSSQEKVSPGKKKTKKVTIQGNATDTKPKAKALRSSPKAPRMGRLGAVASKIRQAFQVSPSTSNATKENDALSFQYSHNGAYYLYPTLSLIGAFIVLGLYYIQYQNRVRQSFIPEIARLRELALTEIQAATDGGWNLNHLRETVVSHAVKHGTPRRYLERHIWPKVEEELKRDIRVRRSQLSTPESGKTQTMVSWVVAVKPQGQADEDRHVQFFHDSYEEMQEDSGKEEEAEDRGEIEIQTKTSWERAGKRLDRVRFNC